MPFLRPAVNACRANRRRLPHRGKKRVRYGHRRRTERNIHARRRTERNTRGHHRTERNTRGHRLTVRNTHGHHRTERNTHGHRLTGRSIHRRLHRSAGPWAGQLQSAYGCSTRDDYHTRHRIAPRGRTRIGPSRVLRTPSAEREHSIPHSCSRVRAGFASKISASRPGYSPAVELHNAAGSSRQQAPIEAASRCRASYW